MAFGVVVSTRKPRNLDGVVFLEANGSVYSSTAGISITISNGREQPIYVKWRI